MKTKRILAAIIAAAAALTMTATVASAEGLGSDEVTLDDEPTTSAEEEAIDNGDPVAPVENPATGNSAVALAVVPVALAAAAVVAKKRK
jgi:hypothetical protein